MPGCYAVTWSKRILYSLLLCGAAMRCAAADAGAEEMASAPLSEPGSYLEIYTVHSATCEALRRGKMRMLRNLHPTRSIDYRMIRNLSGKRQAGLIRETITPTHAEGEPLGCELLDGMQQEWAVIRAEFSP